MKHPMQPRHDFEENRKNNVVIMMGGLPYKFPYTVPVKLPSPEKRSDNELGIWRNSIYNAFCLKP